MGFELSVVIPTHNPRLDYLERVIQGLKAQTLERERWELVVVDNASSEMGDGRWEMVHDRLGLGLGKAEDGGRKSLPNARIIREEKLGLTHARVRGFEEAKGGIVVMVDDDNVLRPDYLEKAVEIMERNPLLGAIGGKALPEYEIEPPEWLKGIRSGLGLRDLGNSIILYPDANKQGEAEKGIGGKRAEGRQEKAESEKRKSETGRVRRRMMEFPECAPIGAGMVMRREAAMEYVARIKEIMGEGVAGPTSLQASPTREELRRVEDERAEGGRSPSTQGLGGREAPVSVPTAISESLSTGPQKHERPTRYVYEKKKR